MKHGPSTARITLDLTGLNASDAEGQSIRGPVAFDIPVFHGPVFDEAFAEHVKELFGEREGSLLLDNAGENLFRKQAAQYISDKLRM